ncbi:TonB-system energizer ExbB [Sulfurimonas diazotrophicus]|uniref:TonB-system energizer ExbB n=1 Tax=Sulfurimonas diazotrophicus TaxID=3131939 RepID=A0ABZ3H7L6_9BACT
MQGNWLELAEQLLDYGVMGTLLVMSVIALWLFIERLMYYRGVDVKSYDSKELLELDLSDNLSTISAIGANAPYVGLLGTILGIMITFYGLGEIGAVDTKKVMTGLALALKATGFGILVAIPSIVFYTALLRKMERLLTYWDVNTQKGNQRDAA